MHWFLVVGGATSALALRDMLVPLHQVPRKPPGVLRDRTREHLNEGDGTAPQELGHWGRVLQYLSSGIANY